MRVRLKSCLKVKIADSNSCNYLSDYPRGYRVSLSLLKMACSTFNIPLYTKGERWFSFLPSSKMAFSTSFHKISSCFHQHKTQFCHFRETLRNTVEFGLIVSIKFGKTGLVRPSCWWVSWKHLHSHQVTNMFSTVMVKLFSMRDTSL